MNAKKENEKNNKVEEPEVSKLKFKGIDHETFHFDAEFAKGLTPEQFKIEMSKRIKSYPWKK